MNITCICLVVTDKRLCGFMVICRFLWSIGTPPFFPPPPPPSPFSFSCYFFHLWCDGSHPSLSNTLQHNNSDPVTAKLLIFWLHFHISPVCCKTGILPRVALNYMKYVMKMSDWFFIFTLFQLMFQSASQVKWDKKRKSSTASNNNKHADVVKM